MSEGQDLESSVDSCLFRVEVLEGCEVFDYKGALSTEGNSATYRLHRGKKISIGRSEESDIYLSGRLVSRKHANICFDGYELYIKDVGSRNGTYLNGQRISNGVLEARDNIKLDNVLIEVSILVN